MAELTSAERIMRVLHRGGAAPGASLLVSQQGIHTGHGDLD